MTEPLAETSTVTNLLKEKAKMATPLDPPASVVLVVHDELVVAQEVPVAEVTATAALA